MDHCGPRSTGYNQGRQGRTSRQKISGQEKHVWKGFGTFKLTSISCAPSTLRRGGELELVNDYHRGGAVRQEDGGQAWACGTLAAFGLAAYGWYRRLTFGR